jgi:1-deoxy-D-xylulose-5-phosphate reductoisomerase
LLNAINDINVDIIVNAISGTAGLKPSLAALNSCKTLALANKETLVMAGKLFIEKAKKKNVNIIPVDSEHAAVFQLLNAHKINNCKEIILTASGGPFRNFSCKQLNNVTLEDALAHPTWKMGPKITIDSATMANKGLEVIEAARLFNLQAEKIQVVIHPQSIVHAMIVSVDGTVYPSLAIPDMRTPIMQAVFWPENVEFCFKSLNFNDLNLQFFTPDFKIFPMLDMAYTALKLEGFYPCAYNCANETAVNSFLKREISFLDISKVVSYVLDYDWSNIVNNIDDVFDAQLKIEKYSDEFIKKLKESK